MFYFKSVYHKLFILVSNELTSIYLTSFLLKLYVMYLNVFVILDVFFHIFIEVKILSGKIIIIIIIII